MEEEGDITKRPDPSFVTDFTKKVALYANTMTKDELLFKTAEQRKMEITIKEYQHKAFIEKCKSYADLACYYAITILSVLMSPVGIMFTLLFMYFTIYSVVHLDAFIVNEDPFKQISQSYVMVHYNRAGCELISYLKSNPSGYFEYWALNMWFEQVYWVFYLTINNCTSTSL